MKNKTYSPTSVISETEKKMLELLAKGASSKLIAQSLGYKDGTARVYLHTLYRRIGVNNKTSAVTWYLGKSGDGLSADGTPSPRVPAVPTTFGDFAVESGLLASLGIMAIFLGPHSKMWEVASRLRTDDAQANPLEVERIRAKSRQIWNAFLRGDFAESKREYESGSFSRLFIESTTDAVVLTMMLTLGGYSTLARKAVAAMPARKTASIGITKDERAALCAVADAVDERSEIALAALHQFAADGVSNSVFRQLVIVALFHLYKMRGDMTRATAVANVIWAESEALRHQLQALGEKSFSVESHVPEPPMVTLAALNKYLAKLIG
ncbi:MAG: helix-turn-helix transcriptional regulator [Betaproteobacteria bacterium]